VVAKRCCLKKPARALAGLTKRERKRKSDFAKWSFLSTGRAKRSRSVWTMNIKGDAAMFASPFVIHGAITAAVLKVRNAAFPLALN
jgi:hypothetical protein